MTAVDHFEAQYRDDPDPWGYRSSPYEQAKYAATLAACGPGPFEHALELGASIGVFSARLAPRCRRLTTIDYSPTAVRRARAALAEHRHARALLGAIPEDLPEGPFDLVVASETLYYLDAGAADPDARDARDPVGTGRAAGLRALAPRRSRAPADRASGPRDVRAPAVAAPAQHRVPRPSTCWMSWSAR